MSSTFLKFIAVLAQFLSVFPFLVLCEGVGYGSYTWWHYPALYATFALFYICGRVSVAWAASGKHSRGFRPVAIFLSKAALAVPVIAYLVVCGVLELSTALFIYALPAAIIMYYGGYSTHKKEYSDIFTRGWFALYFVLALICSLIIYFTKDDSIMSVAGYQFCIGFGVLIVLAAILTNQTNIDICTHQRDSGRVALPKGLRSYNCGLVAAVVAVVVALLLFAVPLGQLLLLGLKQILMFILNVLRSLGGTPSEDDALSEPDLGPGGFGVGAGDNSFAAALTVLLFIGLGLLIFAFRKQIAEFFKELVAPLFRLKENDENIGYMDEFSEISDKRGTSRKKREQQLYRLYRRENDPIKKYRIGYRLMLLRLTLTQYPPVPTDNTDIHRVKGENGLRNENVRQIVGIYNDVRYSGRIPTNEELSFEERFIEEIRR